MLQTSDEEDADEDEDMVPVIDGTQLKMTQFDDWDDETMEDEADLTAPEVIPVAHASVDKLQVDVQKKKVRCIMFTSETGSHVSYHNQEK